MKGLKLHTNGLVEDFELPEERERYIALQKSIDCDCIDIVHAVNLKEPYCMVVDDEGLLKDEPYINLVASYLYGMLEHGQPICGDVIIMKDKFTPDGIETDGLTEEDLASLREFLMEDDTRAQIYQTSLKIVSLLEG